MSPSRSLSRSLSRKPSWQLPPGVTRGVWDYVNSELIAEDYDNYFSYSQLFEFDTQIVANEVANPVGTRVIDLGCGTGRAAVYLATAGAEVIGVDLSQKMLDLALAKAEAMDLAITGIRANLVELDGIDDMTMDHAICLFSTLGMIQGRMNRLRAMQHFHRVLKPGGKLILHVHNVVANLSDPGGMRWLLGNFYKMASSSQFELGDKHFAYRGLPKMFLHTFSASELRKLVTQARFEIKEWIPVDATAGGPLRCAWLFSAWRASGWVVVARRA